jgi:hypothetical protein
MKITKLITVSVGLTVIFTASLAVMAKDAAPQTLMAKDSHLSGKDAAIDIQEKSVFKQAVEKKGLERKAVKCAAKQCQAQGTQQPTALKVAEHIQVIGRRPNPISHNSQGRYDIDQGMLEDYRFGNGHLNEMLGLLPGVQFSEQSYATEQVSNIKPSEVSIAGAQGYQSGYLIDGVSNNSRLSTGNDEADRNLLQDVSGHSQASFINVQTLDSIEVYDSNIPAQYGQFSGGLVKVNTKEAGDSPSWRLNYRQTSDDFVRYNPVYAADYNGSDSLALPSFEKQDVSALFSTPITENSGVLLQFQQLTSTESKRQLGQLKPQTQTNTNGFVKYHHELTAQDTLTVSGMYAPYQGQYFDEYARNSDFTVDGGAWSLLLDWESHSDWLDVTTSLSWHESQNSKQAPSYWLSWETLKGKEWGAIIDSRSSSEGGYGDIDKIQRSLSLKQDYQMAQTSLFNGVGQTVFGAELLKQASEFNRLESTVLYNGIVVNPQIDCNGYNLDCAPTQYLMSLEALEAQLGRPLVLTNIDDLLIYQQNIAQVGQYFQKRQVTEVGQAQATVHGLSLYGEQQIRWPYLELTLGLRYELNDFLNQHNVAPRFRGAVDIFDDGDSVLIFGANRYYDADLSHYKLEQAIQPSFDEVRNTYQNRPLHWERLLKTQGAQINYDAIDTPFSDELSLAFRQQVFNGTLEAKWLKRLNKDQVNEIRGYNEQGGAVLHAMNNGSSEYQRYSLSWMGRFEQQHLEINLSYASNTTDAASFDGSPFFIEAGKQYLDFNYRDSELVFLQQQLADPTAANPNNMKTVNTLVTRDDMDYQRQDFNRPYIANISWGGSWGNWHLSAYARYNSEQEVIYSTGRSLPFKDATEICASCEASAKEYPLYEKHTRPSFWLLSGGLKYDVFITPAHQVTFSFDGENLLNSRTYQVGPSATGTELGRRFWLGVSYQH